MLAFWGARVLAYWGAGVLAKFSLYNLIFKG
jgi:hypothetical protein